MVHIVQHKQYTTELIIIVNRPQAGLPRNLASIPGRAKRTSLLHSFQKGSEIHPASYLTGTGGYLHGDKAAMVWNWQLNCIFGLG
jgi:hypothetical protein